MAELLPQRFYKHVEERPNDVYLTQPIGGGAVKDYTFAEFMDQARRMAAYFHSLDLPPQSRIAILSKNCAHFFMTEMACWLAGHVTVALYPTLDAATVGYILEHSEAKLLFVGKLDLWDEMKPGVPDDLPKIAYPLSPDKVKAEFRGWDDIVAKHEPIPELPQRDGSDESLMIYTSGSTGQPKGVLHTFESISAPTRGLVKTLSIDKNERSLSYLPLAHAMDRWLSLCISMWAGSRVWFAESLDTFVKDLARARPTLFVSVPRLWLKFQLGVFANMPPKKLNFLLKVPILSGIVKKKILAKLGLDCVRFAGSGSAPIPGELLEWYRNLGLELLEGYGMSENFNYSHLTMPGRGRAGYIGHPYPDVECKLSDEGEVLVKSPGMMKGYYKEPELTAECFDADGFLKTGDRGDIDEDGRLRITGRVKDLFKTSKGKYVAPVPIENMLNNDERVELCLVGGSGESATHGLIQLSETLLPELDKPGTREAITKNLEALLDKTNAALPNYERMAFLVVAKDRWSIEGGQLTPTMKIKRSKIEAQYEPNHEAWYGKKAKVIWED